MELTEIIVELMDDMNEDEIRQLGKDMGKMAETRPDFAHCFLVGVRDGLEEVKIINYGFGDTLRALWRHWYHGVSDLDTKPPIPFVHTSHISGQGSSRV